MRVFLDTSVIVAGSAADHEFFAPSRRVLQGASTESTWCAAHSLAEIYSVLTTLPRAAKRSPAEALLIVEQMRLGMGQVVLAPEEYAGAIEALARRSLSGGLMYDALLLACARKVDAERIYTWNLRHFRAIAPELGERIVTP